MSGRNVNIYFQEENYSKVEGLIKARKVSKLINQLVEEWDKKNQQQSKEELRKQWIKGYQQNAQNKKLQTEMREIEAASVEDVFTSLEKKERKSEQNK